MNSQQRIGGIVIALATLAGLAGFVANQVIYFQSHPKQAPEVYTITGVILVILVLVGLLGVMLISHGRALVHRLPAPYSTVAITAGILILIAAVVLPVVIAHPRLDLSPPQFTSPSSGGGSSPNGVPITQPTAQPTSTPSPAPTTAPTPPVVPSPPAPTQPTPGGGKGKPPSSTPGP